MESEKKRQKRPTMQYYTIPASRSDRTAVTPISSSDFERTVIPIKSLDDFGRRVIVPNDPNGNWSGEKSLTIQLSNDNNNNTNSCLNRNVHYHDDNRNVRYHDDNIKVVVCQEVKDSESWKRNVRNLGNKCEDQSFGYGVRYGHDTRFYDDKCSRTEEADLTRAEHEESPVRRVVMPRKQKITIDGNKSCASFQKSYPKKTEETDNECVRVESPVRRVILNSQPPTDIDIEPCLTKKHRQISVDLSTLKTAVHRHMNADILSQTLHHQIRMNKFFSLHKPVDIIVLSKAYRNKDCCREDYVNIIKIVLRGLFTGLSSSLSAEFCCDLIKKDVYRERGEKLCILTFLTALEDLVVDHRSPSNTPELWSKFVLFLAELFFLLEETVSICSLYLLPLISHALNIMQCSVKSLVH